VSPRPRRLTRSEWIDAAHSAGGHYFHFPYFVEALREAGAPDHAPLAYGLDFEDRRCALVPGAIVERALGPVRLRYFVSNPLGAYGGCLPLDGSPLEPAHVRDVLRWLVDEGFNVVEVTLGPDQVPEAEIGTVHHYAARSLETHALNLEAAGDLEGEYSPAGRRNLRRARDSGVTIERAGPAGWSGFSPVWEAACERRGRGSPDAALLRRLIQPREGGELFLAWRQGRAIAGAIVFMAEPEWFYWQGAALAEALPFRPNNLLHHEIALAARAAGARWYNFGASEGLPGVARFKRTFGARPRPYLRYRFEDRLYRSARRLRRLMAP